MSTATDIILPTAHNLGLPQPDFEGYFRNRRQCPEMPGSYLVWLYLARNTRIEKPQKTMLASGWYVYAGSANGPGGLKARLSRHLAASKTKRWHIDNLSCKATRRYGWGWIGATECDLITHLQQRPDFTHPLRGFGSTDCPSCCSHLLGYHPV
ncbi:MAG: GIY-YIG nuclease family protein [Cohaesibacter sp.]|jgi:Uri superfamily endonuclease|nr:GIY-YIG nuclease family protein [Cohaesibacter sp.]